MVSTIILIESRKQMSQRLYIHSRVFVDVVPHHSSLLIMGGLGNVQYKVDLLVNFTDNKMPTIHMADIWMRSFLGEGSFVTCLVRSNQHI